MKKLWLLLLLSTLSLAVGAQGFHYIILDTRAHPAVKAAAGIMAEKLGIPASHILEKNAPALPEAGQIVLDYGKPSRDQLEFIGQDPRQVDLDGYLIRFAGNKALIFGKRPRSLLYAAGDVYWWKHRRAGVYVRQPDFKLRDINKGSMNNMAELIARTGANIVFQNIHPGFITLEKSFPAVFDSIPANEREKLLQQKKQAATRARQLEKACHDADVDFYPFLYGNDIVRWSPVLARALYKVFPHIAGVRAPHSWEKATLNPSLPLTWKIISAVVDEYTRTLGGDGMIVTFWDDYGLYSQDSLSKADGMNRFNNELEKIVGEYYRVLHRYHKPLIVRTWSSGRAHWVTLRNNKGQAEHQFVHAPGYGGFSGTRPDLWGKVIDSLPADIILQTKSYMSDCFPAARNNTLIGHAGDHPQIIEYQMTGQTTGLYYLPAVNVAYTDSTLRRARKLLGKNGGTNLFYGGTRQPDYHLFDDIANSINVFAWKELSWNVNADVGKIWQAWAVPIYGEKAAPYVISALRLSEPVVNKVFSTLGFGWDTNSGFPGTLYRREVLLMYTNRFYLPQYRQYLIPDKKNIVRVTREKNNALKEIDSMFLYLSLAKPYLKPAQYKELHIRFDWLRYVALENKALEVGYWRFRYLRYLYGLRTTDTTEMNAITRAMDTVRYYRDSLFQYDPALQFSGYGVPLDSINRMRRIGLGNPVALMKDIYTASKKYETEILGPDDTLPARGSIHEPIP
ncbi:MAG TPA: hypothetical protein VFX43_03820 [Chitinophagaceae bacterium]|nr:hypothetical protein [Chitinophagaceae bacterium]